MKGIVGLFILLLSLSVCFAKRLPPPVVSPVIYRGVIYSAVTEETQGGYIEARTEKTHQLLWRKQIYRIHYQPDLESDAQMIYITKLIRQKNKLFIEDERGRHYWLKL